jgi:membrane protein YdbS with pleckstrin-like domain
MTGGYAESPRTKSIMNIPLPEPVINSRRTITTYGPAGDAPGMVLPHRNLRSLYRVYLLIAVWVGILPWLLPLAFVSPPEPVLLLSVSLLVLVVFILWWIGAYSRTIKYCFTPVDIAWEQGVWFHQTGRVPYALITNAEIIQGPVSRCFGISLLRIRMADAVGAGFSRELKIRGLTDAGMLREYILARIQSSP